MYLCGSTHRICGCTKQSIFFSRAEKAAEEILVSVDTKGGGYRWKARSNHEQLDNNLYLGFAHGSAGIAYFLFHDR